MIKEITCNDVMEYICESLGEDINSDECKAIKTHLNECGDCKKYFESVEKTVTFYKDYNLDLSPEVHHRLIKILGLTEN